MHASPPSTLARSDNLLSQVEEFGEIMLHLSWEARKQLAQELDHFNLTVPQYVALCVLKKSEMGCTMGELAAGAQQLSPTMTGIVDRLDEAQLVRRAADPQDRRALRVYLTGKGEQVLGEIFRKRNQRLSLALSHLDEQERVGLIRLLQRYRKALLAADLAGSESRPTSGVE
jgi:DNA-binding MarR family transcriptional regulator